MKMKRKGFTLVELIIVLAIFSIIMFSMVQLLDPVSKFFVRSSNFENTTACVDNMRRCIEGNLKYVDRVRAYAGYMPYDDPLADIVNTAPVPSDDLYSKVEKFYTTFFADRKFIDTSGSIFVLVFDNTKQMTDTDLSNEGTISDFAKDYGNSGKIVQFEFKFDNYDPNLNDWGKVKNTCKVGTPWVVNQKLYGAFEYRFDLANIVASPVTPDPSEVVLDENNNEVKFDPQEFCITITSNEIRRENGGLVRLLNTDSNTSSFAMKNVLDATKKYSSPLMDTKTLCANEDADGHTYTVENKTRYTNIDRNTAVGEILDADNPSGTKFDGFYFIYTLPENIHSNNSGFANQAT